MAFLDWHLLLLSALIGLLLGGGVVATITFFCFPNGYKAAKSHSNPPNHKKSFDFKEFDEEMGQNINDSHSTLFRPGERESEMDLVIERDGYEEITCRFDYVPVKHGDILLRKGDRVFISMVFTDGLAHGKNLSSNEEGMFPISHLSSDHFDEDPASKVPIVLAKEGEGKLLFSLVYN